MFRNRIRDLVLLTLGLALSLPLAGTAHADPEEGAPSRAARMTRSGAAERETLPRGELSIVSHDVQVVITNGFATTTVEQVLRNPKSQPVEAAWAFPLPKKAALSELSLEADGVSYMGEVVEKARAKKIYAAERAAGNQAALAEQRSFLHYQVHIARVPAGGDARARVVYVQALEIESGVGRYLYPMSEGGTDDMDQSFWSMERKASGRLSFDVALKTAFPVDRLTSTSHPAMQFTQAEEGMWQGRMEIPTASLDRDFALLYRLHPDAPARIELLTQRAEGASEGTFMAVVTPGSDLAPIEHGTDWAFVLDVSGSMSGEKIRLLKQGVKQAIGALGAKDRFHLVTFNNTARALTPSWVQADAQGVAEGTRLMDGLRAGGGTDVFAGLSTAYGVMASDRPTGIILVSDGVANVGPHHYRDLVGLSKKHDVRIFAFAIGNSANERLLGDMANLTGGTSTSVSAVDQMGAHLLLARERMTHNAIHGIQFTMPGASVVHPKTMPTLHMGQQLVVVGRYDKAGDTTLRVAAKISGHDAAWEVPVHLPASDARNPELERLYALAAIADLERESWLRTGDVGEERAAIVDMALRYSLVTDYTSMVVVEDGRKAEYGIGTANAERRARERRAAASRKTTPHAMRTMTGGQPLAGPRAAHAPSRQAARSGGGGGGGSGAVGPIWLLLAAGLAAGSRRKQST